MTTRMEALNLGNQIRSERANLKRSLAARELDIREVLLDPPDYIATAMAGKVLSWGHNLSTKRVERIFQNAQVNPTREFGSLTERQRKALVASYLCCYPRIAP